MKKSRLFSVLFFILALVMATAFACKDEDEPIPPGAETGLYYLLHDGKEQTILLSNGDKFSLYLNGITKSGTYKLENGVLTFTFYKEVDKKESETLTGELSGDTITLTYQNTEFVFYKRVNRTITFNTGGGSAIAPIQLLNGQYLTRPVDPTFEGYEFEGWYLDAEHTRPFLFETQRVLSDLTLYAHWLPKTAERVEYLINFDLNFGTGSNNIIETKQTTNGKIFSLPEPGGRTGYVFKGWWLSHYDDGNKLSVKMPDNIENVVFKENTTLYAYWQSNPQGTALPNPVVRIDGDNIIWEGIVGIINYELKVFKLNGDEEIEVISKIDTATSYNANFSKLAAGDYIIKVKAIASNPSDNSETTVYYKNKALTRVSHFKVVEPSVLVFNEIDNATNYLISVDCGDEIINLTNYDNGKKTSFNFYRFPMPENGITFTVTTFADGYASSSRTFTYNRRLEKIQKLYFDEETEMLTWDSVNGATNYILSISSDNSLPKHEYIDIGNNTSYCLKEHSGQIVVNVYPKAKGWNSPSPITYKYNKSKLATPRNIIIQNKTIKWDTVSGATSYELIISNQTYTSTTNSFEIQFNIVPNKDYTVAVRAIGDKNSLWSDYLIICDSLSGTLSYWQNTISWNHVIGATNYEVKVNGTKQAEVSAGTNNAEITLTRAGINLITVTAFFENDSYVSADLEVYANVIRFDCRGGEEIKEIYVASGDKVTLPNARRGGYSLKNWYTSWDGGQTFNRVYTDEYYTEQGDLILYAIWGPTTIKITYSYGEGQGNDSYQEILFGSEFELEVPTIDDGRVFGGWFTQENGEGIKIADELGRGIGTFNLTEDTTLYAFWADALLYYPIEFQGAQKGWLAKRGPDATKLSSVKIPNYVHGLPVTEIDSYAFYNCDKLERIELPATIQHIGEFPFNGCINLKEIIIDPANLLFTVVDGAVFLIDPETGERDLKFRAYGLEGEYVIPSDITRINSYAFMSSSGLTKIVLHKDITDIGDGAFSRCTALTEVVFEDGIQLEALPKNIFAGCRSLPKITVPGTVKEIRPGAFDECISLEEIIFEESEEDLIIVKPESYRSEVSAFRNCISLKKLELPARIKAIKDYAFRDAAVLEEVTFASDCRLSEIGWDAFTRSGLKRITIPASVTTIGNFAFSECKNLITVEYEENCLLTTTGANAFFGCTALKYVEFGSGSAITTIDFNAFADCISLETVEFNNIGIVSIGWNAFSNCISLKSITLPDTVTSLASNAFLNCISLQKINIPAGVTSIGETVFQNCGALFEVHKDNPNYSSEEGVLFNKDKTILYVYPGNKGKQYTIPSTVKTIYDYAFYQKDIESIVIPASVTSIGDDSFSQCKKLSSITFIDGNDQLTIENYAFSECIALENITFPKRLYTLGSYAFADCIKLKDVEFGKETNLMGLNNSAFIRCTSLVEFFIPAAVQYLDSSCFAECINLRRVIIEPGSQLRNNISSSVFLNSGLEYINLEAATNITGILGSAFKNTRIRSITIPDNVTSLGMEAFADCNQLLEVNIGYYSQLSSFGTRAFSGCSNLRSIFIPQKVSNINVEVFTNCVSLVNVDVHSSNTSLSSVNGVLFNKNRTELKFYPLGKVGAYQIPSSVTSIGANAFANNKGLTAITFEDKYAFVKIGKNAFLGCSALSIVEFPENILVELIGSNAFKDCTALTSIYLPRDIYGINNSAFLGCINLIDISVHESNSSYASINGVLFNKAKTILHTFPAGKSGSFVIPKTVTTINQYAFANSRNLEKVTFESGSTLTTIDSYTFQYSGIKSIELPNTLTRINTNAFQYSNLESIIIPDTVTSIGGYAFEGCENLRYAKLPLGITDINISCFKDSGLEKIEIPANVTYISQYAFQNCKNLKEITIQTREKRLQLSTEAFKGCSSLEELILPALPDGVEYSFGDSLFEDCISLKTVEIQGSLERTANYTFKNRINHENVI